MAQFACNWTQMKNSSAKILYKKRKILSCNYLFDSIVNDLPFSPSVNRELRKTIKTKQQTISARSEKINKISEKISNAADIYKRTEQNLNFRSYIIGVKILHPGLFKNLTGVKDTSDALISSKIVVEGAVCGLKAGFLAAGKISSLDTKAKATYGIKMDEDGNIKYLGAEVNGSVTYALAAGEVAGSIGLLSGTIKGSVGNAAVKGAVGASLFKDGKLSPALYAKASAEASVLKGSAETKFGTKDENIFAKASGEVLGAKATAEGSVGVIKTTDENGVTHTSYGATGKVGAEAYVAQGSVSGGFTLFGIKISGTVTGKAGGAGVSAGGSVTTSGVSGEIGAGLGLGAGLKINIDWSGFDLKKTMNRFKFW